MEARGQRDNLEQGHEVFYKRELVYACFDGFCVTPIPVQNRVSRCCKIWLHLLQFLLLLCGLLLTVSLILVSNYPIQNHSIQAMAEQFFSCDFLLTLNFRTLK